MFNESKNTVLSQKMWRLFSLAEICLSFAWVALMYIPIFLVVGGAGKESQLFGGIIPFPLLLSITFVPLILSILGFIGVRKFKSWGYTITVAVIVFYLALFLSLLSYNYSVLTALSSY